MKSMIAGLLVSVAFASAAHAAPVVYTDAAGFTAGTSGISTQTFDGAANQNDVIVTPGFTVTSPGASVSSAFYASGKSLAYSTSSTPLVFTFTNAISAFGFDVYDLGTVGATTLTATYNGQTVNLLSNYSTVSVGGRLFAGFSDANASFTTLTLSNSANGDFLELDNVRTGAAASLGAVPEPATWAMMLVGFGGMGFAMRRRKGKVTTNVAFA